MAGKQATLRDLTGERRARYEGSLEFGTHATAGQLMYARDPAQAFYNRKTAVLRSELERGQKRLPARSQNLE